MDPKTLIQQQRATQSAKTNDDDGKKQQTDLHQCGSCKRMLGRHRFQKKIFRKFMESGGRAGSNGNSLVCHQCVREETARRCKQAPPRALKHHSSVAESGTKRRPNNFGYCDYVDKLLRMDCFASEIAPLRVFRSAKDVSESMAALQAILNHGSVVTAEDEGNVRNDGGVLCLCIGDGCTPQTALLISFLTKETERWVCVSIDPALSEEWRGEAPKGVKGLYGYKGKLDEFLADPNRPPMAVDATNATECKTKSSSQTFDSISWRHLVLVCVHSHARFVEDASIERIRWLYSSRSQVTTSNKHHPLTKQPEDQINSQSRHRIPPTTIVSLPCCPTFRHVRDIGRPPDVKYDDDCVFSACRSVEVWNFLEEELDENTTGLWLGDKAAMSCCTVIP